MLSLRGDDSHHPLAHEIAQQDAPRLAVRADLPGMKKDDVCVDVTDTEISISGDRRQEEESERGGVYRSERSYGSFHRTIPRMGSTTWPRRLVFHRCSRSDTLVRQ